MIHIRQDNFEVVLWDRSVHDPALEMGFDTREEAEAAFDEQIRSGRYQTATLMEFHKRMGAWNLLKSFPAKEVQTRLPATMTIGRLWTPELFGSTFNPPLIISYF